MMVSAGPAIMGAGIVITVLHAATPDHWLPFVVVGRTSRWPTTRTVRLTLLSSSVHAGLTILTGLGIALVSLELLRRVEGIQNLLTGGLLIALGLAIMVLHGRHGSHDHGHRASDRAAGAGVFSLVAFAPCYPILPLFLSVQALGWAMTFGLAAIFAAITMGMMVALVLAACLWLPRVVETRAWSALRRHEGLILGGILVGLGLASILG